MMIAYFSNHFFFQGNDDIRLFLFLRYYNKEEM